MFLLCHPSLTAINLSYTFPILETSATALCATGILHIKTYETNQMFQSADWKLDLLFENISDPGPLPRPFLVPTLHPKGDLGLLHHAHQRTQAKVQCERFLQFVREIDLTWNVSDPRISNGSEKVWKAWENTDP